VGEKVKLSPHGAKCWLGDVRQAFWDWRNCLDQELSVELIPSEVEKDTMVAMDVEFPDIGP
jgi:hypothetical protein